MSRRSQRRAGLVESLLGIEDDDLEVVDEAGEGQGDVAAEREAPEGPAHPEVVVEEPESPQVAPEGEQMARPEAPTGAAVPVEPERSSLTEGAPPPRLALAARTPASVADALDLPQAEARARELRSLLEEGAPPDLLPVVTRALSDPARDVRSIALQVLERSKTLPGVRALLAARFDPDPGIRSRVMHLLGRTRDPDAAPALAQVIQSEEDQEVIGASLIATARLLGEIDTSALPPAVISELLEALAAARERRVRFGRELREIARHLGHDRVLELLDEATGWARVGSATLALASGEDRLLGALAALVDTSDPALAALARSAQERPARPEGTEFTPRPSPPEPGPGGEGEDAPEPSGEAVAALVGALDDPNPDVRRRAEEALEHLEPERVVRWLTHAIRAGDVVETERLAAVAVRAGAEDAVPLLAERALVLEPGSARTAVISALRGLERTQKALEAWRGDEDPARRADAVRLAALLDPFGLTHLLRALEDHSPRVRLAALSMLPASFPEEIAERLLQVILTDASAEVRAEVVRVFATAAEELRLEASRRALDDTEPEVRRVGIEILTGGTDRQVVLLARALRDEPDVAHAAARVLASVQTRDALATLWRAAASSDAVDDRVIDVLLEIGRDSLGRLVRQALESTSAAERALAAAVFRRLPDIDVARLAQALTDPAPSVRMEALRGLIERPDDKVLSEVAARLRDPDGGVRALAVRALSVINDDWVLPHLVEACRDPLEHVRDEARRFVHERRSPAVVRLLVDKLETPELGRVASELLEMIAPEVVDLLIAVAEETSPETRQLLGDILSDADQLDAVLEQLEAVSPERRRRAVRTLGACRRASPHAAQIARRLDDPDPSVRTAVAHALGELGNPAAVEPLKRAFLSDPDMDVVAAVEAALRRLTGQDGPAADGDPEQRGDKDDDVERQEDGHE